MWMIKFTLSLSLSFSLFPIPFLPVLVFPHLFLPLPLTPSPSPAIISKVGSTPAAAAEESPLPPLLEFQSEQQQMSLSSPPHSKPFHPFCEVDQSQISIHCHINAISALICVPGMVPQSVGTINSWNYLLFVTGSGKRYHWAQRFKIVLAVIHFWRVKQAYYAIWWQWHCHTCCSLYT